MTISRCIIFGFLLLVSITGTAQENFSKQIYQIVKDTTNHFKSLYGKRDKELDIFFPKNKVDGTANGKIFSIYYKDFYFMEVAGSESKDSVLTEKLFEKWTIKLETALGNKFVKNIATWPAGFKAYFVKGYSFICGHLIITIENFKKFIADTTIYFVRMTFKFDSSHSSVR